MIHANDHEKAKGLQKKGAYIEACDEHADAVGAAPVLLSGDLLLCAVERNGPGGRVSWRAHTIPHYSTQWWSAPVRQKTEPVDMTGIGSEEHEKALRGKTKWARKRSNGAHTVSDSGDEAGCGQRCVEHVLGVEALGTHECAARRSERIPSYYKPAATNRDGRNSTNCTQPVSSNFATPTNRGHVSRSMSLRTRAAKQAHLRIVDKSECTRT